jgi:hypothetical protein
MMDIFTDHARIYDAIAAGEASKAAAAMRDHLAISARAIVAKETGDKDDLTRFDFLIDAESLSLLIGGLPSTVSVNGAVSTHSKAQAGRKPASAKSRQGRAAR